MISLIICSRSSFISPKLIQNIKATIGCQHEVIMIDNSENCYSITGAYNLGLMKAKYDFLVFMHEDILIHTKDWGKILISSFHKDSKIGLIGIAGSRLKTTIPAGWWDHKNANLVINIIQHRQGRNPEKLLTGFQNNSMEEVVVLDGVFIAMRTDDGIKFNESLKGFHNYDQSISLDYRELGYKLFVTNKILIEHFSEGSLNSEWLKSNIKFHQLYKRQLPQTIGKRTVSRKEQAHVLSKFINYCNINGKNSIGLMFWLKYVIRNPYARSNFIHFKFYLKHFLSLKNSYKR